MVVVGGYGWVVYFEVGFSWLMRGWLKGVSRRLNFGWFVLGVSFSFCIGFKILLIGLVGVE